MNPSIETKWILLLKPFVSGAEFTQVHALANRNDTAAAPRGVTGQVIVNAPQTPRAERFGKADRWSATGLLVRSLKQPRTVAFVTNAQHRVTIGGIP